MKIAIEVQQSNRDHGNLPCFIPQKKKKSFLVPGPPERPWYTT